MSTRKFVVRGPRTNFPLDMLRYDSCWPDSAADAEMIHMILNPEVRGQLPGRVSIALRTEDPCSPTWARWVGFGWGQP